MRLSRRLSNRRRPSSVRASLRVPSSPSSSSMCPSRRLSRQRRSSVRTSCRRRPSSACPYRRPSNYYLHVVGMHKGRGYCCSSPLSVLEQFEGRYMKTVTSSKKELAPVSNVHQILKKIIMPKGEDMLCPRDGEKGTSYVSSFVNSPSM